MAFYLTTRQFFLPSPALYFLGPQTHIVFASSNKTNPQELNHSVLLKLHRAQKCLSQLHQLHFNQASHLSHTPFYQGADEQLPGDNLHPHTSTPFLPFHVISQTSLLALPVLPSLLEQNSLFHWKQTAQIHMELGELPLTPLLQAILGGFMYH